MFDATPLIGPAGTELGGILIVAQKEIPLSSALQSQLHEGT